MKWRDLLVNKLLTDHLSGRSDDLETAGKLAKSVTFRDLWVWG